MPRKGYKQTPEARAAKSAAMKGRKQSPEHVAKRIAAAHATCRANNSYGKGGCQTPEQRQAASERMKAMWRDPEWQAKTLKVVRESRGPMSAEHREKIGDALRGKPQSPELIAKRAAAIVGTKRPDARLRCGPLSPQWKGGVTPGYRLARSSHDAQSWRRQVFERDRFTCCRCDKVGGYLNAHHILPFKEFVQFRTELFNGITLCLPCHKEVHADMRHERSKAAGILR